MVFLKLLHLFALFLWLGGLLALLRLSVGGGTQALRALYLRVDLPCMVVAIGAGVVLLLHMPEKMKMGWFHLKLTCALGLVVCDVLCGVRLHAKRVRRLAGWILYGVALCLLALLLLAVYTKLKF